MARHHGLDVVVPALLSGVTSSGGTTISSWGVAVPLVAAVVAAIAAFVWNYALRRRDEKREVRAAARLIEAELAQAQAALERAASSWEPVIAYQRRLHGTDPPLPIETGGEDESLLDLCIRQAQVQVTEDAWRESRMLLGKHLGFSDWDRVRDVYGQLSAWRQSADAPLRLDDAFFRRERLYVHGQWAARLVPHLERARAVCQRYVDAPPAEGGARDESR